jgi:hypothetical protein
MTDLLNQIHRKVCERKAMGLPCTEIFLSREEKYDLSRYLDENKHVARQITHGDTVQKCSRTLLGMKVRLVDDEIHIR